MKAMIVGGEERYAFGQIAKNLATLAIEVSAHEAARGKSKPINATRGCDIIIVLKDLCGHGARNEARALAKSAGIPFVKTSKRWSQMRQDVGEVLQHIGIKTIQEASKNAKSAARQAVVDEQKKLDAKAMKLAEQAEEDALKNAKSDSKRHITEAVQLILEERPETVLVPDKLVERVRELVPYAVKGMDVDRIVANAVLTVREHWKMGSSKGNDAINNGKYRDMYLHARSGWAGRYLDEHVQSNNKFPSYAVFNQTMKSIFGWGTSNYVIKEYRDVAALRAVKPTAEQPKPEPNPASVLTKKKRVIGKSVRNRTKRILSDYFSAASAAGVTSYKEMDQFTGMVVGRSGQFKRNGAAHLHRKTETLILNATSKWKRLAQEKRSLVDAEAKKGDRELEQLHDAMAAKNMEQVPVPGKRIVTEDVPLDEVVEPTVKCGLNLIKIGFVSGPSDRDIDLFEAARSLRKLGVSIPTEIINHFGGVVPSSLPELKRAEAQIVRFGNEAFVDVDIPEDVERIRIYQPK